MTMRYRRVLKWTLYSLGMLLTMLVNATVLGNRTFFGAVLSLPPVYVACVACREGHESGSLFALGAALLLALSGAEGGAVFVLLLPAAAAAAGFFCSAYFTANLLPTLAGCLLALALCEGGVYVQRFYMDAPMPSNAPALLGLQVGLSMVPAPLFWWIARMIGKVG